MVYSGIRSARYSILLFDNDNNEDDYNGKRYTVTVDITAIREGH